MWRPWPPPGQIQKQIQNFKWKSVCGQPQPSSNANSNGRTSAGKTKTKESAVPGTVICQLNYSKGSEPSSGIGSSSYLHSPTLLPSARDLQSCVLFPIKCQTLYQLWYISEIWKHVLQCCAGPSGERQCHSARLCISSGLSSSLICPKLCLLLGLRLNQGVAR